MWFYDDDNGENEGEDDVKGGDGKDGDEDDGHGEEDGEEEDGGGGDEGGRVSTTEHSYTCSHAYLSPDSTTVPSARYWISIWLTQKLRLRKFQ